MATAIPTQLYEKVSEVEALSRNDQLDGQMIYHVSQEEALSRNARQYGGYGGYRPPQCEWRCKYSYYAGRNICENICDIGPTYVIPRLKVCN